MTAAVIDLGSNSVRMGIYEKKNDSVQTIEEMRFPVRLSEGLSTDNKLKPPAMARTLAALLEMRKAIDRYPKIAVKCVATEAMRRAENAELFRKTVLETTDINIEIIGGEQETRFGLWAARQSAGCDDFYMLDTGGGSFELALCENGELKSHICLPYGAVVLTDTFHPDENGTANISAFMNKTLAEYPWIQKNNYPIVLLGGSNRMIGKLYKSVTTDKELDGVRIPVPEVKKIMQTVISMPQQERINLVGMEKNRIDIITAGLAPLTALIEKTDSHTLIISTKSIRDGIANELLSNK